MNKADKAALIYEQKCQDIRSLNEILWKFPVIAMTITGGLWYGAVSLNMPGELKSYIFLFSSIINILFCIVLVRIRFVINIYLKSTRGFEGKPLSKGYYVVIVFSLMLLTSSFFSFLLFLKI